MKSKKGRALALAVGALEVDLRRLLRERPGRRQHAGLEGARGEHSSKWQTIEIYSPNRDASRA